MTAPFVLTPPLYGGTRDADFWPTPRGAVESLLDHRPPAAGAPVVEPAAGDGAIVRVLVERGYEVHAADIRPECEADVLASGAASWTCGDWLRIAGEVRARWDRRLAMATNPPFSVGMPFARACLATDPQYLALLLRLPVLGSATWAPLWLEYPPTSLLTLRRRPSFSGDGRTEPTEYGWFIWSRNDQPMDVRPV